MMPIKEGDYLRVSRNFITDHKVANTEELYHIPGGTMLCTDVGTFRPAYYFKANYCFDRLFFLIDLGFLYVCRECPLASRPLEEQYNWELAYAKFQLSKLHSYPVNPIFDKKDAKRRKLLNLKIIKYTTLLERITHSENW